LAAIVLVGGVGCAGAQQQKLPFHDVRDYGAVGTDQGKDTDAIRKALDAAATAGGGTIYFPAGQYISGPIHLKSNITLHLDAGALLLASSRE
jgi:polygalacturonase